MPAAAAMSSVTRILVFSFMLLLISAAAAGPRRIQMVHDAWTDHFDAVAVVSKRIRTRAVDALAVVFLQAGEVAIGDGNQLLSRHSLRGRNRLEPEILRLVGLVHFCNVVRSAAARFEVNAFDFSDASELHAQ